MEAVVNMSNSRPVIGWWGDPRAHRSTHCTALQTALRDLLQLLVEALPNRAPALPGFRRCLAALKARLPAWSKSLKRFPIGSARRHNGLGFSPFPSARLWAIGERTSGVGTAWRCSEAHQVPPQGEQPGGSLSEK